MKTNPVEPLAPEAALNSSFYEQLVEHVFIAEVLQEAWFRYRRTVEVLRSEIDAFGYDLVLECNGVLRHVQLKTSGEGARASSQNVNVALAQKPGGCVIWLSRTEDRETCRMRLQYLFFGAGPGEPLPSLEDFKTARAARANALGVKKERPAIKRVPKGKFERLDGIGALLERLFGMMV